MHESKRRVVLYVYAQLQGLPGRDEAGAQFLEGKRHGAQIGDKDHAEEVVHDRLGDVDDVDLRIGENVRHARNDPNPVDPQHTYDGAVTVHLLKR